MLSDGTRHNRICLWTFPCRGGNHRLVVCGIRKCGRNCRGSPISRTQSAAGRTYVSDHGGICHSVFVAWPCSSQSRIFAPPCRGPTRTRLRQPSLPISARASPNPSWWPSSWVFIAGTVALQPAVFRSVFAFARLDALPAAKVLRRLSKTDRLPINALLVSAVASMIVLALSASQVYGALVAFATAGFYVAFIFPVLAAAVVRLKGAWKAGPFSLGVFGRLVNVAGLPWLGFEILNIAWPRQPEAPGTRTTQ